MTTQINQDTVNKAVWNACDTFRGTISSEIYKDYVLTMLFLKYLSDVWQDKYDAYSKEFSGDTKMVEAMLQTERFILPQGASYYALYEQRFEPGNGERIDKALHAIEEANIAKLDKVFQDISFNSTKLGEESQKNDLLRFLLDDFAKPELNLRPSRVGQLDIIGNAYEFLIKMFASDAGKKAGEYYTPPEVSLLISQLVDPVEGDEICDPACGSASLLMKCGARIRERYGTRKYALFGQESIGSTWSLAKMNLFLHGEDNHKVEWGDTLRNPLLLDSSDTLKHFDVVVANPPFSLEKWGQENAESDRFGRFRRGVPPRTKGDYAFILHMVEVMKPATGRMAVVAPHGVLFRGAAEGRIRTKLVDENLLDAVIGLPEKLFFGTGIPATILVFRKRKHDDKVLFIDASREYADGKNQNALRHEDIDKIVATYKARQSVDKYAYLATLKEIQDNDYNLNIPRYVDTFEEEPEIDMQALLVERAHLQQEMTRLEGEMESCLKELGYV